MTKVRKARGIGKDSLDMLKIVSGEAKNIHTIQSNLKSVRYIPTIFTSFNRSIVLGGAPVRCTWLIHGPPGSGKTALALGIANSFVKRKHIAGFIDAEFAMSKKWASNLQLYMDGILYEQPDNFEHGVEIVDRWISNFKKGKKDKLIPEETAFVIIIDTIHKLLPKKALSKLVNLTDDQVRKLDENINKGWGRYRANMISTWVDSLTPIVGKNDVAFIILAHEYEKQGESSNSFYSSDDEYKVKGGQTLFFEAMVRLRTLFSKRIIEIINGKKTVVGREHNIIVEKNKVGFPHNKGNIYIGNGKGSMPLGFDLEREAVMEALNYRNCLIKSGSWISLPYNLEQKFQGGEQLISYLREHPEEFRTFANYLNDEL